MWCVWVRLDIFLLEYCTSVSVFGFVPCVFCSLFKCLCPTLAIDSFPPLRKCSLCVFNYLSYLALKRGILLFEFLISAWCLQFAYLSHVVLRSSFFSRPIMSFPVFPSACYLFYFVTPTFGWNFYPERHPDTMYRTISVLVYIKNSGSGWWHCVPYLESRTLLPRDLLFTPASLFQT